MENGVKNSERPQNKNLKPYKKGENGGAHRPLGQKNYATLRAEAIVAVGKLNGKTPEEIEIMLHAKGISEALKGDFRFYKDDLDRIHGTAPQVIKQETTLLGEMGMSQKDRIREITKKVVSLMIDEQIEDKNRGAN